MACVVNTVNLFLNAVTCNQGKWRGQLWYGNVGATLVSVWLALAITLWLTAGVSDDCNPQSNNWLIIKPDKNHKILRVSWLHPTFNLGMKTRSFTLILTTRTLSIKAISYYVSCQHSHTWYVLWVFSLTLWNIIKKFYLYVDYIDGFKATT